MNARFCAQVQDLGAQFGGPAMDELTLVRIDNGMVRGTAESDLVTFKGIPFAQPPVGALRWRAPQPVRPWEGVLEASAFGHDSMQLPSPGVLDRAGISEDSLYLNVWRPAESTGEPLPVMDRFARQGGMVVVSCNYRESRLGFFAHPALADEAPNDPRGNYAYMDQIAALQWVQRNIAAFGGDPGTVTITGESAGGGSVLALILSPMARGLFHRAILESPGLPSPRDAVLSLRKLDSAESRAIGSARPPRGKGGRRWRRLRVGGRGVCGRSPDNGLFGLDDRRAADRRDTRGGAARRPTRNGAGDLRSEQL